MAKSKRYKSLAAARAKGSAKSAANSQQERIEAWSDTEYLVCWTKDGVRREGHLSALSMAEMDEVRKVLFGGRGHRTNLRRNGDPRDYKICQEKSSFLKEYFRRYWKQESTNGVVLTQVAPGVIHRRPA